MTCPCRSDQASAAKTVRLHILKVLEFNAQTLKSGVVVRNNVRGGLLFLRGAPMAIRNMGNGINATVPADFDQARPCTLLCCALHRCTAQSTPVSGATVKFRERGSKRATVQHFAATHPSQGQGHCCFLALCQAGTVTHCLLTYPATASALGRPQNVV